MEYRQLPHGTGKERFGVLGLGFGGIGTTPVEEIEAIVSEMGHDKVFLYKGGKAESAIITKGIRNEALVQVIQGLEPGDTVITTGTMQLREGQKVTLDEVKQIEN